MNGWLLLGELAVDIAKLVNDTMNERITHDDLLRELQGMQGKVNTAVDSLRKKLAENDAQADEILKRGPHHGG